MSAASRAVVSWSADQSVSRTWTPGGSARECPGAGRPPDEVEDGQPRDHPVAAVERVRDGLQAVGGSGQDRDGPRARWRQHPLKQLAADVPCLELGQHEQHPEEPGVAPLRRRPEADDHISCRGHHEAFRIGREEVREQASQRLGIAGEPGLVQPPQVVLDADRPDLGAGEEIVVHRRPILDDGPVAGPAASHRQSTSSTAPTGAPVACRSSSADMKASRSPSSTAAGVRSSRRQSGGP